MTQEALRSYLQLQDQLHTTQLAIERNRQEADTAAARNAEALTARLQMIEQALAAQRSRELEAMQNSNRVMLLVAASFGAVGLLAVLLMAYFQWRAVGRLAEISAVLPATRGFSTPAAIAALGPAETRLVGMGQQEANNGRLLDSLDRLEKRINELEHTARAPVPAPVAAATTTTPTTEQKPAESKEATMVGNGGPAQTHVVPDAERIPILLNKGQSLLNLDQADEALACFDEILSMDAKNTEALVKKGAALEKLRRLNDAMECYDKALAVDDSMTIAYLYKGGIFNRLERFTEALECYELALKTQEQREGKSQPGA
jgi:tetratricopeptide (TPR) repeat protein